jgi:mannose/cellobiose epimerase-like protein (N-acyl-D-glucosamine 2-epimerase family)
MASMMCTGHSSRRIALDLQTLDVPKSVRVQPRRIYVFGAAAGLGCNGPWREFIH